MVFCNCFRWRSRRNEQIIENNYVEAKTPIVRQVYPQKNNKPAPVVDVEPTVDWTHFSLLAPYKDSYWIKPDSVEPIRSINSNYMKTILGSYKGESVIIRLLPNSEDEKARKQLISETLSLTRVSHPNIVRFVGFTITEHIELMCICEYVQGRTLREILDKPERAAKLTWPKEKINIAIGVASALAYMHSLKPALIHRNIKASKVLLTNGMVPKLSGFGVSRDRSLLEDMTIGVGDLRWSAPELLLENEIYDEKIDVYSFGVLLTELDTCKLPFAKEAARMKKNELQGLLITGRLLPRCSRNCPQVIIQIVKMCLQHDPRLRPSSCTLLELLEEAKSELRQA